MTCFPSNRDLSLSLYCLVAILTFLTFFANPSFAFASRQSGELEQGTLNFQERERTYFYHLPEGHSPDERPAVLFALHGGGPAEGDDYARRTGYNAIADREGFIVVYPNGVDAQWNDGRGATFRGVPENGDVDDVGFISALIDVFIERHNADPGRIYVEGSSNGGMMTQRIACELSGRVAAVAGVISSMPSNIFPECAPQVVMPVLMMNSTADPWVPWNGGPVTPMGRPSGEIISTWDAIQFWASQDQCNAEPRSRDLPNLNRRDDSTVRMHTFSGCQDGAEVILYEVIGAGHTRPGMVGRAPERLLGSENKDIIASVRIWDFLSHYRR